MHYVKLGYLYLETAVLAAGDI